MTRPAWQRDALYALAETPGLTAQEYERRRARILALTAPEPNQPTNITSLARHGRGWSNRDIRHLCDNAHRPISEIAQELGRTPAAVKQQFYRFGLAKRPHQTGAARVARVLLADPGMAWSHDDLVAATGHGRTLVSAALGALRATGAVQATRVNGRLMFRATEENPYERRKHEIPRGATP